MPDVPDIAAMTTAVGRQGAPSSGAYGERAEVEQLQRDLPAAPPAQPAVVPAEQGPAIGMPPTPMAPGGGLPAGMLAPSRRPDESMSQPLGGPQPIATTSPEQRIQWFHAAANDPKRSEEFREWAQTVLDQMIR